MELARICSVDGCDGKHDAKGFCKKHYARWHTYGNPHYIADPKITAKKISEANKGRKSTFKGRKHTIESKNKISEAGKGRKQSEETKNKRAEKLKGHIVTKKTRDRISKANKGQKRPKISEYNKIRIFTQSTRKKMSMNQLGKKLPDETKEKISKSLKGREISVEHRKKLSKSLKGKKKSVEHRTKISEVQTGRKQSEETVRKRTEKNKGQKRSDEFKKMLSDRVWSDESRRKLRIARRYQVTPKIDTKPEKFLQKILKENRIEFQTHKAILGQPDIFIIPNFCIFVDGDRYHANPAKYNDDKIIWNEYNRKGRYVPAQTAKMIQDKDKRVTKKLEEKGYQVLRFWESELYASPEKCLKSIQKFTTT
jgi:G:T-mismatch repair DNA endonuclease (very short patch repair protein)